MSLSKDEIKQHYRKVESLIKEWGENDGFVRIGSNGPGRGWYKYPQGYDGNIRRPKLLTTQGDLAGDYEELIRTAAKEVRSIYSTLNFLNPETGFVQVKESDQVWRKEDEEDNVIPGNPLPEYSDIEFMTLFSDVDLKTEFKPSRDERETKKTVKKSIEIYVRELKKLAPNSINVLDSGGGFYPFIHHDVTKPIGEEFDEKKRGRIFDELTDRFNEKLEDIWETVKEEVPETSRILDPDMLNNKNRLMKVPLSIHKDLDIVVHPIDPQNPDFDPEQAPAEEKVIQETKEWLQTQNADSSDIETLVSELWPDYEGTWEERLEKWYEEDKRKREKREKERLEHKRKMEERRGGLGEKGKSIKGFPVTNCFEDILSILETIDMRDMVTSYITDERDGIVPRFDPPWRGSDTGTSCFADREKFVDINEGNTGGGPAKFAARESGIISSCDKSLEGEKWWEAVQLLRREYGYKIPILIPDTNTEMPGGDSETYDQTPHWGIIKAGFAFGIIDEDDLQEKEPDEENGEKEQYLPIGAVPGKYNQILRELEKRGFDHGRDKRYFAETGDRFKFIPKLLGDDILHDYHFATNEKSNELYVYQDGIYQLKGESVVGEIAQERLDTDARNTRIKETIDYIKRATYTPTEEFGTEKRKIGVENGILNLETKELEEFSPDRIILTKLPVKYDPNAEPIKITQFIHDIVAEKGDVEKIQQMLGYTLLRENPLNKAFMGLGGGANGRSTLFELFQKFLGEENTAGIDLIELVRNRFASADLFGKIANFCADIGNKKIGKSHSNRFKKVVGEDRIRAEHKNQDAFHFTCYATPWFSANELPETGDKTRSFYRRWVIIQFPYTFTFDPDEMEKEGFKERRDDLPDILETEEELSGLLNWTLEGLDRALRRGKFTNERSLEEKRELWELESNPVAEFLDKWCIKKKGLVVPKEVVRQAYTKFCEEEDNKRVADQTITKRLKRHGITSTRPRTEEHGRVHCYQGFTLDPKIVEEYDLVQVVQPFSKLLDSKCKEVLDNYPAEYNNSFDKAWTTPTKGVDRDETQQGIESFEDIHLCEECKEDGLEKEAAEKGRMSGEEKWLCPSCLRAAGYEEKADRSVEKMEEAGSE